MCSIAAVGGTNQHLKLYLSLDRGYSQGDAARIISLVLALSIAGRLLMGWLADRIPKKQVMLIIYLLVAASIPLLFLASFPGAMYAFAVVFGLGLGGEYLIIPLIAAELFGVKVLGRLLGPRRDLVGVQIMKMELVDQGFFDLLVQDKVAVGIDLAPVIRHRLRHVTVDIDGLAINAVAGDIGDVVAPVDFLGAANDCIECAVHHQVRHVPFGHLELLMRRVRMTEVQRHDVLRGSGSMKSPKQTNRTCAKTEPNP